MHKSDARWSRPAGSCRFETGHHVVVREQCEIGDDVSGWSNTVIDIGDRCLVGAGSESPPRWPGHLVTRPQPVRGVSRTIPGGAR
jgi:hypothetical protein